MKKGEETCSDFVIEILVEKTLVDVVETELSVANIVSANPMNVRKSIFITDEVQE